MKSFSNLHVFCEYIIRKYDNPDNISEEQLAEEFRTVYLKNWPLDLRTLRAAAAPPASWRIVVKCSSQMVCCHSYLGYPPEISFKMEPGLQ